MATEIVFGVLNAFFIPGYGVVRAMQRLVLRPALIRGNHLEQAAAAGALGMVVSSDNLRTLGRRGWAYNLFGSMELENCGITRIHGRCMLPAGYYICEVPLKCHYKIFTGKSTSSSDLISQPKPDAEDAVIRRETPASHPSPARRSSISTSLNHTPRRVDRVSSLEDFDISSDYSIVKALFGLFQALSGILTLYHARGDQLQRYGYGAFSLSVVPYVFMSIVNFAATILCPTYPTMYLVHTPDLDQAEFEGGSFDGIIAQLDVDRYSKGSEEHYNFYEKRGWEFIIITVICFLIPIAAVGGLSGFKKGDSTAPQRGWLMTWLVAGSISGLCAAYIRRSPKMAPASVAIYLAVMPFWIPAIGGMVMVGKGMREYGTCIRIDD